MTVCIGVDVGLTGALCAVDKDNGEIISLIDMPVETVSSTKNRVSAYGLANWFEEILSTTVKPVYVAVEKVGAMPKQGTASMFNFGDGFGVLRGVIAGYALPVQFVTPQKWKKQFHLIGKDKDCSRTLAQAMYPRAELHLKKHHGRGDAILIANWLKVEMK